DEWWQRSKENGERDNWNHQRISGGGQRRGHYDALPNNPMGRKASRTAIGPKMTKYASSGNITCPIVLSIPTSNAPTAAPTKLPLPPMMTIARENTRISESAVG